MNAREIIVDAWERLNLLSPGEALSDDNADYALRRLNALVDLMSAQTQFLFRDLLTSAAQTGHITLGAGSWSALSPSDAVVSVSVDGNPIDGITMTQYAAIYDKTTAGAPTQWAQDGLSTVYFWPVASGQTIQLQTQAGVAEFADLTTEYTAARGYRNLLAASLAVRCAHLAGGVTAELLRAERLAQTAVKSVKPAIVDCTHGGSRFMILNGA